MRDKFAEVLARIKAGAVRRPGDTETICEALEHQIARVVFVQLDWGEWTIGARRYLNWIGYAHIHKLLSHPGEQTHCCDLTHQPGPEHSRKAVQKSLRRAMDEIASTQPDIGVHLQDNIKTGEHCVYLGAWDWRTSSQ